MPIETLNCPVSKRLWRDTHERYGRVSRWLHWLTAALLLLQFTVIVSWRLMGENGWTLFLAKIGPHGSVGMLLLAVALLRCTWALSQRSHRPAQRSGWAGHMARWGHASLYALLITIPALAMLRHYGRDRPFHFYGVEIISPSGQEIAWLLPPANLLHSTLSWLLLALIVGHIAMALLHRFFVRDGVWQRMVGSTQT